MDQCILIKANLIFEKEIKSFRQDMLDANSPMDGTGSLKQKSDVKEWLEDNEMYEKEETLPKDWVIAEQFIYVRESDHRIVGMIQFRHYLNDFLAVYGGHIGYSVRPSERRKGYAKRMLNDCLKICKNYGLQKVLVTCYKENEASRRTILANGGVYENTVHHEGDDKYIERYWINI